MGHPLWRVAGALIARPAASGPAQQAYHRLSVRKTESGEWIECLLGEPPPDAGSAAHRLLLNLLRGAGLGHPAQPGSMNVAPTAPNGTATLALPPLRELLGQPDAKRALWPTLRALRRSAGSGPGA